MHRRHATWYLELSERLERDVRVHGQSPALRQLDGELGNVRTALQWWLARADGEHALRMAAALEPYWDAHNQEREGVRVIDAALAVGKSASVLARARAHTARAALTWWAPKGRARRSDGGLRTCARKRRPRSTCSALHELALHTSLAGDFAAAAALARQDRALAEELDDPYHLAVAIARQAYAEPDVPTARAFADEAIGLLRRCGSQHRIAGVLSGVTMAALADEDYEAAEALATEGVAAAEQASDAFHVMTALGNAGLAALLLGRFDVSERRFRSHS